MKARGSFQSFMSASSSSVRPTAGDWSKSESIFIRALQGRALVSNTDLKDFYHLMLGSCGVKLNKNMISEGKSSIIIKLIVQRSFSLLMKCWIPQVAVRTKDQCGSWHWIQYFQGSMAAEFMNLSQKRSLRSCDDGYGSCLMHLWGSPASMKTTTETNPLTSGAPWLWIHWMTPHMQYFYCLALGIFFAIIKFLLCNNCIQTSAINTFVLM